MFLNYLSRRQDGFLMGGGNVRLIDLRYLMKQAGDIETNPGPRCAKCETAIRENADHIICSGCEGRFHKKCTGLNRSEQIRQRNSWKCENCSGRGREEIEEEVRVEQEEREANCTECKARFKKNTKRWRCKDCDEPYHAKCTNLRRGQRDRQEEWKCKKCEENGVEEGVAEEEPEEQRTKCIECKIQVKKSRFRVRCTKCKRDIHGSCSGLKRVEVERTSKAKDYICRDCKPKQSKIGVEVKTREKVEGKEDNLRILQWNCGGLRWKAEELKLRLEEWDIDVAAIQETHLKVNDEDINFDGFQLVRKDRTKSRGGGIVKGGGVAFLIKEDISYTVRDKKVTGTRDDVTEAITVEIVKRGRERLEITNIYAPPVRNTEEDGRRQEFEVNCLPNKQDTVLLGDFNCHNRMWDKYANEDGQGEELKRWAIERKMVCLNDGKYTRSEVTRGIRSTPDITWVRAEKRKDWNWEVKERSMGSDHYPIIIESTKKGVVRKKKEAKLTWKWKEANWEGFTAELEDKMSEEEIKYWEDWKKIVLEAAKNNIPVKGVKKEKRIFKDEEVEELRKEREEKRKEAMGAGEERDEIKKRRREEIREMDKKIREKETEKKRTRWREFLEENEDKNNDRKIWQTIHSLNKNKKGAKNENLVVEGEEVVSDKRKANKFICEYAEVSNLKLGKEERRTEKDNTRRRREDNMKMRRGEEEGDLTIGEVNNALREVKNGKAAGPDGIHPGFLKNLGPKSKDRLLEIFNKAWKEGNLPQDWRTAIICPLLKDGKPPEKIESYRPVALTSCVGKVLEKIIGTRLSYWMERKGLMNRFQAGFRKWHSTEDQIIRIVQNCFDGLQKKPGQFTLVTLFDFSKAYDKVWRAGLINKLWKKSVPGRFIQFMEGWLVNRTARVRFGNSMSKVKCMKQGVPQGSCLSPLLFTIFADDIDERLDRKVQRSMYADDVAIWITGTDKAKEQERMQGAVNVIHEWAEKWKMTLNPTKSECGCITTNSKMYGWDPELKIGDTRIAKVKKFKFLGVIIDQSLSFKEHVDYVCKKMEGRIRVMKKLSGTDWGRSQEDLLKVYKGYIEPIFMYCGAGWLPFISKTNTGRIQRKQNKALRVVLGAVHSTPQEWLTLLSGTKTVKSLGLQKACIEMEKSLRLKVDNPRRETAEEIGGDKRKRWKDRGWRDESRRWLEGRYGKFDREDLERSGIEPWNEECRIEIDTDLEKTEETEERRKEAIRKIDREKEECEWLIYTDGSAKNGTKNGGLGVSVWKKSEEGWKEVSKRSGAAGTMTSSFLAESWAMREAVREVRDNGEMRRTTIMTDSLSLLKKLKGKANNTKLQEEIRRDMKECGRKIRKLMWIPGHQGLEGNERADELAGEGSRMSQNNIKLEWAPVRSRIKNDCMDEFNEEKVKAWEDKIGRKGVVRRWKMERGEFTDLMRLITGHSERLRRHLKKLGKREDDRCRHCGEEEESVEHLMDCDGTRRRREKENWGNDWREEGNRNPKRLLELLRRLTA